MMKQAITTCQYISQYLRCSCLYTCIGVGANQSTHRKPLTVTRPFKCRHQVLMSGLSLSLIGLMYSTKR